jgi:hypothetical protein
MSLNDWEEGTEVPADKEGEYLKDLCAALREQQTLSPLREDDGSQVCSVVPDDLAAHAAEIIEELWERLQLWEGCGMEFDNPQEQKASLVALRVIYETQTGKRSNKSCYGQYPGVPDDFVYEISKGAANK